MSRRCGDISDGEDGSRGGGQYNADTNSGDMLIRDLAYYPRGAKLV
ncbi:hypothetical protein [Falsirhodobacter sp. 1013]